MDRYRVAPARPVFLSGHLQPAAATRRSGGAERELDIFTAERYFNAADAVKYSAAAVHADNTPRQLPVAAVDAAAGQSGRTAASSEASWNSRSGLLASDQSSSAARQHDKGYGGGVNGVVVLDTRDDRYHRGGRKPAAGAFGQRWGIFSRDCPCAGRKAVTVDVASEPATPRNHVRFDAREESAIFKANGLPPPSPNDEPGVMKIFTTGSCAFPLRANDNILAPAPDHQTSASFPAFPPDVGRRVVSSGGFTFPVISPSKAVISTVLDEPPRESLEVFRPIDEDSVVLVDPPPPLAAAAFLRAPAVVSAMDDDAMSDASSDLFDLESFAASSSYPTTYRGRSSRRNSGDEDLAYAAAAAEPALSECMYAPSEASVVWSVATAEGVAYDAGSVANFSSSASACGVDEFRFVPPVSAAGHDGFTAAMSRSAGRKKGGGFLDSCRCEKAVSVGPTPVRVARPPAVPANKTAMGLESGGVARYHNRRVHMPVRT
ncbi:protein PHYTOCHROME KINASE SUBSTRATE 4-like [Triticum dicoccoides]|uniref:protein PHYTOCHROME KINASE SUBSTRATE 4-like n=1 Tax=Triticum dicoccoides TaxID=85692 RepID=UPI000E7BA5F1|nr:protein PHYTOCHROME KINASE SUBSTRATE 4-like [Triticum dicoccoides]